MARTAIVLPSQIGHAGEYLTTNGLMASWSEITELAGYVPYTGATTNLDMGVYTLAGSRLTLTGDGTNSELKLIQGGTNDYATIEGPGNRSLRIKIVNNDVNDKLSLVDASDVEVFRIAVGTGNIASLKGSLTTNGNFTINGNVGSESLNETNFATHAKWDTTGDFNDTGGNATYAHSTGVGTLIQTQANLAIAGVANERYAITYTITGAVTTGNLQVLLTTSFFDQPYEMTIADGTYTFYFMSAGVPTDFTISATSDTPGDGFTITSISLKQVTSGDSWIMDGTVRAQTGLFGNAVSSIGRLQVGSAADPLNVLFFGKSLITSTTNLPSIRHHSLIVPGTGNDLLLAATSGSGGVVFATGPSSGGALNTLTGSNRVRGVIDVNGFWGIGNNFRTPVTLLHVSEIIASSPRGMMSSQHNNGVQGARLHFRKSRSAPTTPATIVTGDLLMDIMASGYDGTSYLEMGSIQIGSSGTIATGRIPTYMAFFTATNATTSVLTERMRIDNAGNIGINNTDPLRLFEIAATGVTSGTNDQLRLRSSRASIVVNKLIGGIEFISNDASLTAPGLPVSYIRAEADGTHGGSDLPTRLVFGVTLDGTGTPFEAMRIDNAGNVGIGTTGPDRKLDILDATNPQLRLTYTDGSVYSEFQTISSGNILAYFTGSGFEAQSLTSATDAFYTISTKDKDGTDQVGHLIYGVGTTGAANWEALKINWSPSDTEYKINTIKQGTGVIRAINIYTDANTNQLFLDPNGSVGIKTNANTYALNVGGTIKADDYVYEDGTYAGIYVTDGATPQNIPTGVAYTKITGFTTNGLASNATPDVANDKITITKTGKYRVFFNLSMTGDTNNVTYRAAAFLNGVEQSQSHDMDKFAVATDTSSMHSSAGTINVTSVPVDLDLRIRHDNGGTVAITPVYASLAVEYKGE